MSRVIKSAVLHGEPKIVETVQHLSVAQTEETEGNFLENKLTVAATCAVMLEESKTKAAEIVAKAENQRDAMITQAMKEVDRLLSDAGRNAEAIRQQAYDKGKEQGLQDGLTAGKLEAEFQMEKLINDTNAKAERILQQAEIERKNLIVSAEKEIIDIILAITNKILPQHFIDSPQVILPLVKAALGKVKDQNAIVIKISPENYEFVLMAKNELQMMVEGEEAIAIVADPLLGNDGCVIESSNGNVDARLETQLEIIKKAVQEVMLV